MLPKSLLKTAIPFSISPALISIFPGQEEYKIIVNYNSQADLLLSLQIFPDYYPYQFKSNKPASYLINPAKYIIANSHTSEKKQKLKKGFNKKISYLFKNIKEKGEGLWDNGIYNSGLAYRNDQFWNNKKTSLLFIEQFIADDYVNINDAYDRLPVHKHLFITNHRASRDPYTIFSSNIFECFKNPTQELCNQNNTYQKLKEYIENYNLVDKTNIYKLFKYIEFWNQIFGEEEIDKESFNLFNRNPWLDTEIAQKYEKQMFDQTDKAELYSWDPQWKINYLTLAHHSVFEQQTLPGSSPLIEGSQKDVLLYLKQFAILLDKYSKTSDFEEVFSKDIRKEKIKNALNNATLINNQLNTRLEKIRDYFKAIKVVDEKFTPKNYKGVLNSKTFAIVTFPPNAYLSGDSVIQTISKYPFIYQDIGLKQVIPKNVISHYTDHENHIHNEEQENEMFAMGDEGWWWDLGNYNLSSKKIFEFEELADQVLFLSTPEDWKLLNVSNSWTKKLAQALSNKKQKINYSDYHLWNEGSKSPIALNMVLDNLINIFQKQYDSSFKEKEKYKEAMDWGDYWSTNFLSIK